MAKEYVLVHGAAHGAWCWEEEQVTYGGMPVVVEALEVFKQVLEERGEWEA